MELGIGNSWLYKCNGGYAGEASKTVPYTKIISRKRVVIPETTEELAFSSPFKRSFQKQRSRSHSKSLNYLETLPQDILIRVLSYVDHGDLKHLVFVSKAICNAALIAKESHFAFKTPIATIKFKGDIDAKCVDEYVIPEAPNAPKRISRIRLGDKDLAAISVALFTSANKL